MSKGQKVKVLGENYSLEDEEDMFLGQVEDILLFQGRYSVAAEQGYPGNWILLTHLD